MRRRSASSEEQGLADQCADHVDVEWFCQKKGRLSPLASKQPLWKCCDENHRHLNTKQYLVNGFQSRAIIGQLNVCQDQPGALCLGRSDRFFVSAGQAHHAMPQSFNEVFEIHCNQWLVFNDQYVGLDLLRNFASCLLQQLGYGI